VGYGPGNGLLKQLPVMDQPGSAAVLLPPVPGKTRECEGTSRGHWNNQKYVDSVAELLGALIGTARNQ
jgi:hypothetical protein